MFHKDIHILVVDDSLNIRRLVVDNLQRLGFHRITTAEDATEAFNKLKFFAKGNAAVGLVLSDLNMPGPSGLDFLRQVRSEGFAELPFLLVTTESEKGAVIEAATHGVSGYVIKPFNLEILTRKLKDAAAKHGIGAVA